MMKLNYLFAILILFVFSACQVEPNRNSLLKLMADVEGIAGKSDYLSSPYTTAGDRVYMVGHQDGTFPDLGWHVTGEMGGIWNHPIKLMDGFTLAVSLDDASYCLDQADQFINYPFANRHLFHSQVPGVHIDRFQFVPQGQQGLIIEIQFKNVDNIKKTIGFEFTGHTDLMPVWLGEEAGMVDKADTLTFDSKRNAWRGKDVGNNWFVLFGSNQKAKSTPGPSATCNYSPQGNGRAGRLGYEIHLKPEEESVLTFFIAGSYNSLAETENTYNRLAENAESYLLDKKKHYQAIAARSKITIPDKELQQAFEWVKYNTEWLVRDVPEIGRGLGAGMPDYPWWFGVDNEYTLKGAIATGRKDLVYETIALIHKLSEANRNGRIVHEVSTNGIVFNPGNINETPQFASLIWWVYQWTGDKEFLAEYFPTVKKGLKWLMEEHDKDGNLFPDGYGMMEIHGLESEMIDVAVYTQQAFTDAAQMALVMNEADLAETYQHTAAELKVKINSDFWVEEFNSYADFIGTTEEALDLLAAATVRADTLNKPWAVEELADTKKKLSAGTKKEKQGFVIFHNWVVNTPMEMGIADSAKAIKALDKGSKYVNPFGVYVTGIDRDEEAENEDGTFVGSKVFSYTGAVMTLPTGVSAIGENNYGRPDHALDYLQRMTKSFSFALPGAIYEVSPDYGMMAQAWNLYSYGVPIVTQFFGIKPDAGNKVIHISPLMPTSWEEAKIEKVLIGNNEISLDYKKIGNEINLVVTQTQADWEVIFQFPAGKYRTWALNGIQTPPDSTETGERLTAIGGKIKLSIQ